MCHNCKQGCADWQIGTHDVPMMYLWCTHDTMAWVHGYAWGCQIHTHKHCDTEPTGFPILMTIPIQAGSFIFMHNHKHSGALNQDIPSLRLLENLLLIGLSSPHHLWPSSSSQSHQAFKSPFWPPSVSKLPTIIPLSDAYNTHLCRLAFLTSYHLGFPSEALKEGTYAWVSKPAYETCAEGQFL